MGEVAAAGRALGFEVVILEVRRAEDFAPAFEGLTKRADALYISSESLISANRVRIIILALAARMPTIYGERMHVELGGLWHMERIFPIFSVALLSMLTRFCAGRSRATSPSSSRPSSISSSI